MHCATATIKVTRRARFWPLAKCKDSAKMASLPKHSAPNEPESGGGEKSKQMSILKHQKDNLKKKLEKSEAKVIQLEEQIRGMKPPQNEFFSRDDLEKSKQRVRELEEQIRRMKTNPKESKPSTRDDLEKSKQRVRELEEQIRGMKTNPKESKPSTRDDLEKSKKRVRELEEQIRGMKTNPKESKPSTRDSFRKKWEKSEEKVQELEEQIQVMKKEMKAPTSSRHHGSNTCSTCAEKEITIADLRTEIGEKEAKIAELYQSIHDDSRRRQGEIGNRMPSDKRMEEAKRFVSNGLPEVSRKLAGKTFSSGQRGVSHNRRQYLCWLFQRVYDTTHLHLMQEMDKKIFLEGNTEVQEEYNTWFLQGYALLLSACKLTGACPPELQTSIKESVKKEIMGTHENEGDSAILSDFIKRSMEISWEMVTAILPIVSSCSAQIYDEDIHQMIGSVEEPARNLVYSSPALHACFDPRAHKKAVVSQGTQVLSAQQDGSSAGTSDSVNPPPSKGKNEYTNHQVEQSSTSQGQQGVSSVQTPSELLDTDNLPTPHERSQYPQYQAQQSSFTKSPGQPEQPPPSANIPDSFIKDYPPTFPVNIEHDPTTTTNVYGSSDTDPVQISAPLQGLLMKLQSIKISSHLIAGIYVKCGISGGSSGRQCTAWEIMEQIRIQKKLDHLEATKILLLGIPKWNENDVKAALEEYSWFLTSSATTVVASHAHPGSQWTAQFGSGEGVESATNDLMLGNFPTTDQRPLPIEQQLATIVIRDYEAQHLANKLGIPIPHNYTNASAVLGVMRQHYAPQVNDATLLTMLNTALRYQGIQQRTQHIDEMLKTYYGVSPSYTYSC